MADYTAPDEERNFMNVTQSEGFTLSDNFEVKAVDMPPPGGTQPSLFGEIMDPEEYKRNLERIEENRHRLPAFYKSPVTTADTIREINEHGWESHPELSPDVYYLPGIDYRDTPQVTAAGFLRSIGVDLNKEHHRDTPRRLAAAMKELTTREEFKFTTFEAKSQNMITLGPIPFYTMCAHHTLPFHGNAWIGYVPDTKIAGLSKFARTVEYVSKGFHVQEELTTEIHDFLTNKLEPKGMVVVMKAEHMCMAMRGVRASGVITTTSEVSGVFADHTRTAKAEFLEWIRG
jgi:GTP cyclohydrolase I